MYTTGVIEFFTSFSRSTLSFFKSFSSLPSLIFIMTTFSKNAIIAIEAKPRAHEHTRYVEFKHETSNAGVRKTQYAKVPMIADDATHIEVLKTLREFELARLPMQMTNGPELYTNFR